MSRRSRDRHLRPKTISVDFDGVLHLYTTFIDPWDATVIPDPPVQGAINWLAELVHTPGIEVVIFSSRNHQEGGIAAMQAWLLEYGIAQATLDMIGFPTSKPSSHLHIDDRAFMFRGQFPTAEEIKHFRPWNKQ